MFSLMMNTRFNNVTVYFDIIIHASSIEQVTGYYLYINALLLLINKLYNNCDNHKLIVFIYGYMFSSDTIASSILSSCNGKGLHVYGYNYMKFHLYERNATIKRDPLPQKNYIIKIVVDTSEEFACLIYIYHV